MNAQPSQLFQRARVLTAISGHRYHLTECATTYHKHVWHVRSEKGSRIIIKSPLRNTIDGQRTAIRQLNTEMTVLSGPLRDTKEIRQLVDQIILANDRDGQILAGVFEHLDFDLHNYHLTQKHPLSRHQIKSITRQLLRALSKLHKHNIVHTGECLSPNSPYSETGWLTLVWI
jgi:serine/threonine protein kinase